MIPVTHLSRFYLLAQWIEGQIKETAGTKVLEIEQFCRKIPKEEFISMVKLYIDLSGGEEIELNSDYTAIRIYGKKETKWIYKNK